jgi:hypothetical protein
LGKFKRLLIQQVLSTFLLQDFHHLLGPVPKLIGAQCVALDVGFGTITSSEDLTASRAANCPVSKFFFKAVISEY